MPTFRYAGYPDAKVVDDQGNERPVPAEKPRRVVEESTARDIITMMEAVVGDDGTARNVVVDGYRLAVKTGTAQNLDAAGNVVGYNATFAGLAPADDPKLVTAFSPAGVRFADGTTRPTYDILLHRRK